MVNMALEWRKHEEREDGTVKESYLNIPIKLVGSVDSDYGYSGQLICNKCNSKVEQVYVCSSCKDKASIGEIQKRKDRETKLVYIEEQKREYLKNEVDKTIKVVGEVEIGEALRRTERLQKPYELYNNDEKVSPIVVKIYGYLLKHNKALVVKFGYSNRGKSNDLGGLILVGDGKLLVMQLRDYRLIRPAKQQGLPQPIEDEVSDVLNNASENHFPELMEKFLEEVRKAQEEGKEIEVTVTEKKKKKIVVEADFLD